MNINDIEEELFCQKIESQALSEILCYKGCERWIYGFMLEQVENEHLDRYNYALNIVKNKKVLDVASGCGFGSFLFIEKGNAKSVVGVDISEDAIRYSNHRYKHKNIERIVGNAETIKLNNSFDIITSFETIEHLSDYDEFLKNIDFHLSENGIFLVSTPIISATTKKPYNPHHTIEWSYNDFYDLISKYFKVSEVFFQNIVLYSDYNKDNFFKKILFKTNLLKKKYRHNKTFEKNIGQYNYEDIKSGFQMFVCFKK